MPLGRIVATPGLLAKVNQQEIAAALSKHERGIWGDLPREDAQANDQALLEGTRVLASHKSENGTTFWLITEADRSATTVLLPEEY